ncbi:MAG TPA: AmmeMemoRadiSam system radical SAM enzyme [Bacteroidales bacterium]|nr:AmmeMemoRadiSam system radical SAM enzyme [Bacteroidales bacterium]
MKEALYYEKLDDLKVRCLLCPHHCVIGEGKSGICKVRKNVRGFLYTESYGAFSAIHLDPIEKKPLYHFYPGKMILSAGSVGCNLSCIFCQNYEISQSGTEEFPSLQVVDPEKLALLSLRHPGNIGLAYTYNEPFISFEMIRETAPLIKRQGQKNVMVTNGFMNPEPLGELLPWIDAFNVDLKGFTESFYRKYTRSRLVPVLDSLKQIRKAGVHLEITNLIIPGANDDEEVFQAMVKWIANELGKNTVLHLSRYFPAYKLTNPPTPSETLYRFFRIARKNLNYVYVGNIEIPDTQNTYCPSCGALLIKRSGYITQIVDLDKDGFCSKCRNVIDIKIG